MSDAGPGSKTLKALLLSNALTTAAAVQLGAVLGEFLAKLHEHGRSAPEREEFAKYQWAKQISAWYTHGRVLDSLNNSALEPPLEFSELQLAEIKDNVEQMMELIRNSEETLIMGDFWTGNIVIQLKESDSGEQQLQNVLVVDWEISKFGTPGNDVGQFTAEIYLPYTFAPACSHAADAIMKNFCLSYRSGVKEFDASLVNVARKHLGSHIVVLAPSISPWNSDKLTVRKAVEEGLLYLMGKLQPPLLAAFQDY
jgi:thiamine kinase-like enzyme